jgi:hypothetical protein
MADHEMSRSPPQDASVSQSKRTLLKAGWVAPVVVVLSLPAVSFDANASGGSGPPSKCPPGRGRPGGWPRGHPHHGC